MAVYTKWDQAPSTLYHIASVVMAHISTFLIMHVMHANNNCDAMMCVSIWACVEWPNCGLTVNANSN